MPIGNLTSQIFANIYLNELDQFILHSLKPLGYVRYGDDFVVWYCSEFEAKQAQLVGTEFLRNELKLAVNSKHDRVQLTCRKLGYLGVDLWPYGKRLNRRVQHRSVSKLNVQNASSYHSITKKHLPGRYSKRFLWNFIDFID